MCFVSPKIRLSDRRIGVSRRLDGEAVSKKRWCRMHDRQSTVHGRQMHDAWTTIHDARTTIRDT
jgi:hypothetical protein